MGGGGAVFFPGAFSPFPQRAAKTTGEPLPCLLVSMREEMASYRTVASTLKWQQGTVGLRPGTRSFPGLPTSSRASGGSPGRSPGAQNTHVLFSLRPCRARTSGLLRQCLRPPVGQRLSRGPPGRWSYGSSGDQMLCRSRQHPHPCPAEAGLCQRPQRRTHNWRQNYLAAQKPSRARWKSEPG